MTYDYNYTQDSGYCGHKETPLIRDARLMEMFGCHSGLVFRVCLDIKSFATDFEHRNCVRYQGIILSLLVNSLLLIGHLWILQHEPFV